MPKLFDEPSQSDREKVVLSVDDDLHCIDFRN